MPYIRACITPFKETGREQTKGSRGQAGSRPERAEPDKGDRAESRGRSKAKNHSLQELVSRQQARGYTRG